MADCCYLKVSNHQQGGVLIPVLFFASMITLGVIILLQSHITQKISIIDFKDYLNQRRKDEQLNHYVQSLPLDKLLKLNNLKLIQKISTNLHYQNSEGYYFFESLQYDYIYKLVTSEQDKEKLDPGMIVIKPNAEFDYFGMRISVIQMQYHDKFCFYLFDKIKDKVLLKSSFKQEPYFQLVGNPVKSIYVHDTVGLYKIDLSSDRELLDMHLLKQIDPDYHVLPISPVITRDARGDGRQITLAGENKNFVYHEPSEIKSAYLDLFDHYYFSGK
jgi:hypothetical protein